MRKRTIIGPSENGGSTGIGRHSGVRHRLAERALAVLALLYTAPGLAAHPLITEDTGTQGRGHWQLELTAESGHDEVKDAEHDALDLAAALAYGLRDDLDLVFTLPYARSEIGGNGMTTAADGLSDVGVDLKWRFLEHGPLSVALKTGFTLASGDESKGLGAGKANLAGSLVASYETGPWGAHLHLGYFGNRNVYDERDRIRHASIAGTYLPMDRLKLVADLGTFTSADRSVDENTSFLTLGMVYTIGDDFDIDAGVKHGLTDPETDTTLLFGVTLRF